MFKLYFFETDKFYSTFLTYFLMYNNLLIVYTYLVDTWQILKLDFLKNEASYGETLFCIFDLFFHMASPSAILYLFEKSNKFYSVQYFTLKDTY